MDSSRESFGYEDDYQNSSDLISWYSSDYEQQQHDLNILDKLGNDTQRLIERQNNCTLLKKKNEKYSTNLITSIKNNRYMRNIKILQKPDTFFEDLQQFREDNEKYTKSHEGTKFEVDHENDNQLPPPENCKDYMKSNHIMEKRYLADDEKYFGYYSLNERLFPVHDNKCYLYSMENQKESNIVNNNNCHEPRNEIDEYPIKISIKKNQFKPIKHVYKHHRRKSYEPSDSISLKSYLHKGYEDVNSTRRKKESNTLSLNKELHNGKNPKEITFNQQYYFY
ncbi:hypothetical protein BCR36DRAFT_325233 [Piromyces finnis]|uniref:Uncharacterized protein n=1 Tax=Piromyces finnis TaxID=1754191 RepID=A0A1Y1VB24_9FUNG|nr:hypothetical protein BCR36DRAFT_325233 [Piromyces finnis]|eukprot:ORX51761.1 hypothetical protein BCR36DRAFT_325233 [Piromyces finnis]